MSERIYDFFGVEIIVSVANKVFFVVFNSMPVSGVIKVGTEF